MYCIVIENLCNTIK